MQRTAAEASTDECGKAHLCSLAAKFLRIEKTQFKILLMDIYSKPITFHLAYENKATQLLKDEPFPRAIRCKEKGVKWL